VYGGGPFKEIQLYLNNVLIAVDYPFPTIYTGGINPLLWRPVVAIGAYSVPSIQFDITPVLPLLMTTPVSELKVNVTFSANPFWLTTPNLLVWVDHEKDPADPFEGKIERLDVNGATPAYNLSGEYGKERVASTSASNRIISCGIINHSKGWTRTEIITEMQFKSTVITNGGHTSADQATNLLQTKRITVGKGKVESNSWSETRKRIYPLKIELDYLENEDQNFELHSKVSNGLHDSWVKESQSSSTMDFMDIHNSHSGQGYFGTIRPGACRTVQILSVRSPSQCFNRTVEASKGSYLKDELNAC
jgi:uroporphyrinogen decarboxylase